jgi:2-succinyl-5-enolpyruvyl-6-hydroxy-3-cyclohexene-1-carboxylate synthase
MGEETFFEGRILPEIVDAMPDNGTLFVASSMPVRHLDQFVNSSPKPLRVFSNRGASGIDGTISSALGVASTTDTPLVLVIGDLAFYHDLNGLMALKRSGVNATIVLINNDGGGIFRRLPIAKFDPPFTELFLTPHGLDFEPVVRMYGAGYSKVETRDAFRKIFKASIGSDIPVVIEVSTDSSLNEQIRQKINNPQFSKEFSQ